MSQEELLKRRDHLCRHPFVGLVVNPSGHITVCCRASSNWKPIEANHIDEIDDLTDFYNGAYFQAIRKGFVKGAWKKLKECSQCAEREDRDGGVSGRTESFQSQSLFHGTAFDDDFQAWERGERIPVRFLEFTMSNLCTQQCSTCSSFYSTRWKALDEKFGRDVHDTAKLSKTAVEKLDELLPDLELLLIKGGEPFADPNNLKLLQRLHEVNPKCWIHCVSNMQKIREDWWPTIKAISDSDPEFRQISISVSIDGIGDVYNWIRGGNFESTMQTIRRYHKETGRQVVINTCVSIYNFFNCAEIFEYFAHDPAVHLVLFNNITMGPEWITIANLPQKVINKVAAEQVARIEAVDSPTANVDYTGLAGFCTPDGYDHVDHMWKFMDQMNEVRGYRIEDLVPGLKNYRKKTVGLGPEVSKKDKAASCGVSAVATAS